MFGVSRGHLHETDAGSARFKRKSLIKRALLRFIWVFAEYKYHRLVDDLGEAGELRKIPFSQKNPVCKK